MTWEAAPPRVMIGGDASGDGGDGSGDADPDSLPESTSRSFDNACTTANQPWGCFDGSNVLGVPLCTWKGLGAGTSVVIDSAFKGDEK